MKRIITYSLLFITCCLKAQVGGTSSFQFLNLPENARVLALGGENVSTSDYDVNSILYNPASLRADLENSISLNYLPFYADIKKISAVGVFNAGKAGPFGVGIQYLSYGKMTETDVNGVPMGEFRSGDMAINVTKSHELGPIRVGGTLKFISSQLANYHAAAVALDFGGMFVHPEHDLKVGLVFKNLGVVLSDYDKESNSVVPFNVQLGASYKPEHMPVRFSITGTNLNVGDVQYLDPARDIITKPDGEKVPEEKKFSEQLFRRIVFGTEFVISDNFYLRVGYNHRRRKELSIAEKRGATGFSFGFMLKVKKVEFNYTKVYYHLAGGANVISIGLNMNESFGLKRTVVESEF